MDALTVAAAALAVATEHSRDAALHQALLDRERAAMSNEDVRSWVAQRVFTESAQPPRTTFPMTWAAAYEVRHENFLHARDALRDVRTAHLHGDAERIDDILSEELGDSSEEEEEEEEPRVCVLCRHLTPEVYEMAPRGRWAGLAPEERRLCGACYRLQPPAVGR